MKNTTLALAIPVLAAGLTLSLTAQELGPPPLANEADFVPVPSLPGMKAVSVNPMDRAAVVRFYQTTYRASEGVAAGWDGNRSNCDAGTTSQAYADATILRVNYFRAMVGPPGDVVLSNAWNLKAQEAALMITVTDRPPQRTTPQSGDSVPLRRRTSQPGGASGRVSSHQRLDCGDGTTRTSP